MAVILVPVISIRLTQLNQQSAPQCLRQAWQSDKIVIDQIREKKSSMTTTSEDVWRILAELATAQAELTAAQKETDKQLKEVSQQQNCSY